MIDKDKVKKVAVIKLCCLGDIIFLTPTMKNLKFNFPNAEIVLIASDWLKSIANLIPAIDKYIIYNPPENNSSIIKKILSGIKLIQVLKREKFDLAFLGHRTNFLGLILFLSGIRYRLGFSCTHFINYKADFIEEIHETKRYLKVLESAKLEIHDEGIELKKPETKELKSEKFTIGIFPFGGINPGTVMEIKRWELNKYFQLINLIKENYPEAQVILFEGKLPKEKLTDLNNFKNFLVKEKNITEISKCDIFIAGDTGPLHIAAAMGISTLGIFGPSSPEHLAPLNNKNTKNKCLHIHIWKKIECSPCYTPTTAIDRKNKKFWKGNNFICYKGTNECIKSIAVEEVFFELKKIVDFLRLKSQ